MLWTDTLSTGDTRMDETHHEFIERITSFWPRPKTSNWRFTAIS
jgi:hemerythrin